MYDRGIFAYCSARINLLTFTSTSSSRRISKHVVTNSRPIFSQQTSALAGCLLMNICSCLTFWCVSYCAVQGQPFCAHRSGYKNKLPPHLEQLSTRGTPNTIDTAPVGAGLREPRLDRWLAKSTRRKTPTPTPSYPRYFLVERRTRKNLLGTRPRKPTTYPPPPHTHTFVHGGLLNQQVVEQRLTRNGHVFD